MELAGIPAQPVVAAALGGAGHRVHGVEGLHGPGITDDTSLSYDLADRWLVRGLDPLTLAPQSVVALPGQPRALAVAGERLYVPDPADDAVTVIDRRSGAPLPVDRSGRGPVGIVLVDG